MSTVTTETWTGSDGASWPAQWYGMGGQSPTISGNAGALPTGSGSYSQSSQGLSAVSRQTNFLSRFQYQTSGGEVYASVSILTDGGGNGWRVNSGYTLELNQSGYVQIDRMVNGGLTNLGGFNYSSGYTAGQWHWVRFKAAADGTLSVTIWKDGGSESSPLLTGSVNDTTFTSGRTSIGCMSGNDGVGRTILWDDLTITDAGNASIPYAEAYSGSDGAAWSSDWSQPAGSSYVYLASNRGRIKTGAADYNNAGAAQLAVPVASSYDVTVDVNPSSTSESYIMLWAVSECDGYNARNGYGVEVSIAGNGMNLNEVDYGGGRFYINNGGASFASGLTSAPFRLRVAYDAAAGTLSAKAWAQSGSEPSTWGVQATGLAVKSGRPSIGFSNGKGTGAMTADFDNFTIKSAASAATASGSIGAAVTASAVATATVSGAISFAVAPSATARQTASGSIALAVQPTATATSTSAIGSVTLNLTPSGNAGQAGSGSIGLALSPTATAMPKLTGTVNLAFTPSATAQSTATSGTIGLAAAPSAVATPQVTGSVTLNLAPSATAVSTVYASGSTGVALTLTGSATSTATGGSITLDSTATASAYQVVAVPPLSPFTIQIWSAANAFQGAIVDPVYCTVTPRFPGIGSLELALRQDDVLNTALQAPGASITVQYRGEYLYGGPITSYSGSVLASGQVTYQSSDWWMLMKGTLGFVNPANPVSPTSNGGAAQVGTNASDPGHYDWGNPSTAEAAIKQLTSANFTRLGRSITIEANQGRGGSVSASSLPAVRFNTLQETVEAIATPAGLRPRIRQVGGSGFVFEVTACTTFPGVFSAGPGILSDGSFSRQAPAATRVIIGGPGDDQNRAFLSRVNSSDESAYGFPLESYKDATNATVTWPDGTADSTKADVKDFLVSSIPTAAAQAAFLADMTSAATDALADGAATAGLSVTIGEGQSFHYGGSDGYHVGDTLTVRVGGQTFTNAVTEAVIDWGTDGLQVTPTLGSAIAADPDLSLIQIVNALATALRRGSLRK